MVLSTVHCCLRTKEIEEVDLTSASHHWHSVSDYVLSLLHVFVFLFFFLLSLSLSFLKDVTLWSTELSLQF